MRSSILAVVLAASAFAAPERVCAQPDITAFGERMGGEDLYGVGGAIMVPLKSYRYDMVLGGQYFFADADTTSPWMINLDTHLNLFSYRLIRPYVGVGLNYHNRDGDAVGMNLKTGVYIRFMDWLIPYFEYTYRTIPSIEHSYIKLGARVMLRQQ